MTHTDNGPKGEIVIYRSEDGSASLEVRLEDESVWLTQAQMVELFQTTKQNVSLHTRNVFRQGELREESVVKEYLTADANEQSEHGPNQQGDPKLLFGYSRRFR